MLDFYVPVCSCHRVEFFSVLVCPVSSQCPVPSSRTVAFQMKPTSQPCTARPSPPMSPAQLTLQGRRTGLLFTTLNEYPRQLTFSTVHVHSVIVGSETFGEGVLIQNFGEILEKIIAANLRCPVTVGACSLSMSHNVYFVWEQFL